MGFWKHIPLSVARRVVEPAIQAARFGYNDDEIVLSREGPLQFTVLEPDTTDRELGSGEAFFNTTVLLFATYPFVLAALFFPGTGGPLELWHIAAILLSSGFALCGLRVLGEITVDRVEAEP